MMFASSRLVLVCLALILLALSIDSRACSGRLHIEVQDSGVYALDYAAIITAQPGLKDCPGSDLMLLNRGKEVPIRVHDDGSGKFAAGSRIEWVGQALHGPQSWYDQYSPVNVYLLAAAPGAHARMRELRADVWQADAGAAKPAALRRVQHFEQENLMIRLGDHEMKPGDEPDVWQWAKLTPIDPQPFAFAFDLPDADLRAQGADIALTLDFRGESNVGGRRPPKPVDHSVEIRINDKLVQTLEWDGRDEVRRTLNVPRALFKSAGNQLSLRVPRRDAPDDVKNFIIDVVMFNWLEVTYPIRGDLDASATAFRTMSNAPVEFFHSGTDVPGLIGSDGAWRPGRPIGAGRYRAAAADSNVDLYPFAGTALKPVLVRAVSAGDLRAGSGFDYVMVAHPRLREAIEPLARYHEAHGHKVAVVNVDDVYDQFGGGIIHPAAIRDFVAWGVEHWQIKPRYLLLVGDASVDIHHDIRDAQRLRATSIAPGAVLSPEMLMTPGGGFNSMTTYSYTYWDPDLSNRNLIPTWQVPSSSQGQSASDAPFVALKSGDFHPQLAVGRLPVVEPAEVQAIVKKTLSYLVDTTPGRWRRDMTFISSSEVESFKGASDKLASDLGDEGYAVRNVYTDFNDKNPEHALIKRAELKHDLDEGNLLVHFLGHGGSYIWRVGPAGDLFALDDVAAMSNAGRYPMVLAMTCFSAPFDNPTDDSIGERFLREANKGAVAVFAASWSNSPNPANSRSLIEQLLRPGMAVGDAISAVKAKSGDRTFVEMYNLLGDPALVLARPQTQLSVVPVANRWDARVLVHVPAADFGGTVDVDWLDGHGDILASRRYEARNSQFYLPLPDEAEKVLVYVADTRNLMQAFGSYVRPKPQLPAPPSGKLALAQPPASPPPRVVTSAPATTTPPRPAQSNLPDRIAKLGFDASSAPQPANPPSRRH